MKQIYYNNYKLCNNIIVVITRFMYEYILTIVTNQGIHFINDAIKHLKK
jgi:hypothetical protein